MIGEHTVMDVLTSNSWGFLCSMLYIANLTRALELGTLSLKSLSYVLVIAVAELSLLNTDHVMCV